MGKWYNHHVLCHMCSGYTRFIMPAAEHPRGGIDLHEARGARHSRRPLPKRSRRHARESWIPREPTPNSRLTPRAAPLEFHSTQRGSDDGQPEHGTQGTHPLCKPHDRTHRSPPTLVARTGDLRCRLPVSSPDWALLWEARYLGMWYSYSHPRSSRRDVCARGFGLHGLALTERYRPCSPLRRDEFTALDSHAAERVWSGTVWATRLLKPRTTADLECYYCLGDFSAVINISRDVEVHGIRLWFVSRPHSI